MKTTDGGITWTIQYPTPWTGHFYCVCFPDHNTGYAVGSEGAIFKTIDGGTTWNSQSSSTSLNLYSVYFADLDTGYIVGDSGIILKTVNGGVIWDIQPSPTDQKLNAVKFPDANTGYIVGNNGTILKTTNGGGTVGMSEKPVVSRQSSVVSYPNPTRGIVDFRFSIFDAGRVTLKIFDVQGREMAVVLDEDKTDGEHTIRWNADGMPAGVYYYSLRSGKQANTGKIIVMK